MFSINIVCYNIVNCYYKYFTQLRFVRQLSLLSDKAALCTLVTQIVINYLKRTFLFMNYK